MPLPSSATRRLYDFLGRFHSATGDRRDEPIENVLRNVFNEPKLDVRDVFRLYSDLIDLAGRALGEVRAAFPAGEDPDHARELADLEHPIASLRATLMSNSPKSAAKVILQHRPDRLQALAATTSRLVGQGDPSAADMKEVADKLRDVLSDFLATDVPAPLKEAFRAGVERLLKMIDHYSIFGPEGIVRVVGELTGQLSVRPESRAPEARASVTEALNRVADAVTIITSSIHLGVLARPLVQGLLSAP